PGAPGLALFETWALPFSTVSGGCPLKPSFGLSGLVPLLGKVCAPPSTTYTILLAQPKPWVPHPER
ncbi:MAG TPA: hypothetical protein VEG30_06960, partial [Terriglobales bacterium]|nr:hypothetical protein [Terriglobales bacterium]